MNKTEQLLKAKYSTQPTKLSKEDLTASLIKSMAAQLSEPEQEKEEHKAPPAPAEQPKQPPAPAEQEEVEKQAIAPLSKSQVESRLARLDAAIENSNSHLMRSFLTAAREKTIRDNVPITISTNVQKSNYKYSMGDMNLVVSHLRSKGASNSEIERALLWMASQKQE